jgi:hypothetical protein
MPARPQLRRQACATPSVQDPLRSLPGAPANIPNFGYERESAPRSRRQGATARARAASRRRSPVGLPMFGAPAKAAAACAGTW